MSGGLPGGQGRQREPWEIARCQEIKRLLDRFLDRTSGPTRIKGELTYTREAREQAQVEVAILETLVERLQRQTMSAAEVSQAATGEAAGRSAAIPRRLAEWLRSLDASRPAVPVESASRQLAAARSRLAEVTDEENAIARQISLLQDQLPNVCDDASRPGDLPPARVNTPPPGDSNPGGAPPASPDANAVPAAGSILTGPGDWNGTWKHGAGTVRFDLRNADQTSFIADERLRLDNAFGARVQCDEKGVYGGEVEWDGAADGFAGRWNGQVFACTNGNYLEGKISNFGMHSVGEPDISASFRIAFTDKAKRAFGGSLQIFDVRARQSRGGSGWSGTKQ